MGNRSTSEVANRKQDKEEGTTPTSEDKKRVALSDGSTYEGETVAGFFGGIIPHGKGVCGGPGYFLTGTWISGSFLAGVAEYYLENGRKIYIRREAGGCYTEPVVTDVSFPKEESSICRMIGEFRAVGRGVLQVCKDIKEFLNRNACSFATRSESLWLSSTACVSFRAEMYMWEE